MPAKSSPKKIYTFGYDVSHSDPLVFDGREPVANNEFPVRSYDFEFGGNLDGLSEILFSSFGKLLECLTHYMTAIGTRDNYDVITDFFSIDPTGAGKTGIDYWLRFANNYGEEE